MDNPRWWHAAVGAMWAVLTGMILLGDLATWQQVGAQIALTTAVVGWYTIGWRALRGNILLGHVFTVVIVVSTGTATAFQPFMANMLGVCYPLVWVMARTLKNALLANVALALSVGAGFFISTGQLVETSLMVALSLGFSLAIGLWITQIQRVSSQREALVYKLRTAQDQIAMLNRDVGITGERERLAREIHDTIAQDITGLVLLVQRARRDLDDGRADAAAKTLATLEESARSTLAETRALVAAGAPIGLATGGIAQALERLGERFERETGIQVSVSVSGSLAALDRDTEVVLLRCAQEGLANVRKHARASAASVTLVAEGDGPAAGEGAAAGEGHAAREVTLSVTDDGIGFDPGAPSDGFGLSGLRDRLALASGELSVVSTAGGGTRLSARLRGVVA